jgi:UrcA family protein
MSRSQQRRNPAANCGNILGQELSAKFAGSKKRHGLILWTSASTPPRSKKDHTMFARFISTTALVLSTLAVSPAAHAQDATATVRIPTASLTSDAGHKAAIHRIEVAARSVCGYGRSLAEIASDKKCAKELSAIMVEKLASAELALQTGRSDNTKVASR